MHTNTSPLVKGAVTPVVHKGNLPDTSYKDVDKYLSELKKRQAWWAKQATIDERIELLEKVLEVMAAIKDEWAAQDALARKIPKDHWDYGNSLVNAPGTVPMHVRAFIKALKNINKYGVPKLYKKIEQVDDRVKLTVFPQTFKDSIVMQGVINEIYLGPGTSEDAIDSYQALNYKNPDYSGGVSLVLAAGNHTFIGVMDVLQHLFFKKHVVLLKTHPVLENMHGVTRQLLKPFEDAGIFHIVSGGSDLGQYLTRHDLVDEIHLTGSDKTFEAIVYGTGETGQKNKKSDHRITNKKVFGELGCVSPVIVVPGQWKDSDYDYQAINILSLLAINQGYNCLAPRVIILPKKWQGSEKLLARLKFHMKKTELVSKYYPGTDDRINDVKSVYPDALELGPNNNNAQSFIFVTDLDPNIDEYACNVEVWAAFCGQVYLDDESPDEFLNHAVEFSNEKLWGTLSATIIIDPKTKKQLEKTGTFQKAIRNMRYGTVGINTNPFLSNILGLAPWGGYPGSSYQDIQSGNEIVENPLMLEHIEKSVLHTPFRMLIKPVWFFNNPNVIHYAAAIRNFAISNSWLDVIKVILASKGWRKEKF
jgi:acyl-CoA reductase-like NAD-dependent aldehyde dehydrogenase